MNKQKGNMYGFVTHTWNPIKGTCPHDCSYCYMKVFPQGDLRLDEKALNDNLGEDNFIFVGSSTDMFADEVSSDWIRKVLLHCNKYPKNKYLFQSKNPNKTTFFSLDFPKNVILGTTIETNRDSDISKAPSVKDRQIILSIGKRFDKFVTIEPIMDFDLEIFVEWLKEIKPVWVAIGADSKGHNLSEPSWEKVQELIKELKRFTEVRIKDNLERLRP